jgi:1,4-alpha-glucan branching enzyme
VKKECYIRSLQKKKEVDMAKKDGIKKVAEKTSTSGKAPKTRAAKTKAPVRMQKKETTLKKAARVQAKAETVFRLISPQATQVFVVGCFNGWDPTANPLMLDNEGAWSCSIAIEPGEHEYRFIVDGVWCDDPSNTSRRLNEFGTQNCVLIV